MDRSNGGDRGMEIGRLGPFRSLLAELERWEEDDRLRRPEDDPALLAITRIRKSLEAAVADAQGPIPQLKIADEAALQGVTPWAIYKRRARNARARSEAA